MTRRRRWLLPPVCALLVGLPGIAMAAPGSPSGAGRLPAQPWSAPPRPPAWAPDVRDLAPPRGASGSAIAPVPPGGRAWAVGALTTGGLAVLLGAGDQSLVESTGDALQFALPGAAFASTAACRDPVGTWQYATSGLLQLGLVRGLKALIHKTRLGGLDDGSFPSGHTATAFGAAAFLARRYGWPLGVPAYAAATFTGLSRVMADRHFVDDVVAGAGIGFLCSELLTTPRAPPAARPRWRVDFEVSRFHAGENEWFGTEDTPDGIELENLGTPSSQDIFSRVELTFALTRRTDLFAGIEPLEQEGRATPERDLRFGHTVFPAGQPLVIHWLDHEVYVGWRTLLVKRRAGEIKAGLVLAHRSRRAEVSGEIGFPTQRVGDADLLLEPFVQARWRLAHAWSLVFECRGLVLPEGNDLRLLAALRHSLSKRWDVSLGYRFSGGQSDEGAGDINGTWGFHSVLLGFGVLL